MDLTRAPRTRLLCPLYSLAVVVRSNCCSWDALTGCGGWNGGGRGGCGGWGLIIDGGWRVAAV